MRDQITKLSKSRFMTGLQCYKGLYLSCYHPKLADPIGLAQQAIFDTGTMVGELARNIYPGGILIIENHFQHEQAVKSTQNALQDPSISIIYEAAFLYDDIRIRADILVRISDDLFDLIYLRDIPNLLLTDLLTDFLPHQTTKWY